MSFAASQTVNVRSVSGDHVAHYERNGWVHVTELVDAETVGQMQEAAERYDAQGPRLGAVERELPMWREWRFVARDDRCEPFVSVALASAAGRDVSLIDGHGGGVRYWNDILAKKSPTRSSTASTATGWHQDFPNHPIDRVGGATIWIALADVDPDQGAMSFVSGSHREGPLGRTYSSGTVTGGRDQLEQHPWLLDRYEVSQPVALRAGDATFHHPLVVHGSGLNRTDKPRWSFIVMYIAADAVYTGATYPATDSSGLQVGAPFDNPSFPLTWPGEASA